MTPDNTSSHDLEEIATRLHAAAIHLLRTVRREDAAAGLTAPRLSVLSVLVFGGPLTIGALAAAEQVSAPTMTKLVAGLARDGLVERRPAPSDGRSVVVAATARARDLLLEGRTRRVRRLMALIGALPEADLATVRRATEVIEQALRRE